MKSRADRRTDRDPAPAAAPTLLLCNIILVLMKGLAGIIGGSVALQADAVNSLGDVLTIILVYFGLRIASRPRDAEHPYGHGRIEDIIANIMGVVLALFGVLVLFRSVRELIQGVVGKPEVITVWVALASVVIKEAMYRFANSRGKVLRSPALSAVAADFRSDVFISLGVLAGILGAVLRWPLLDPIVSLPVSLMVIYMGLRLCRSSIHVLMDGMPDEEVIKRAVEIAEGVPGVDGIHEVKGRYSGRDILLDMKIEIDPGLTVSQGHEIAHGVQDAIISGMKEISSVLVHVNPSTRGPGRGAGPAAEIPPRGRNA